MKPCNSRVSVGRTRSHVAATDQSTHCEQPPLHIAHSPRPRPSRGGGTRPPETRSHGHTSRPPLPMCALFQHRSCRSQSLIPSPHSSGSWSQSSTLQSTNGTVPVPVAQGIPSTRGTQRWTAVFTTARLNYIIFQAHIKLKIAKLSHNRPCRPIGL
jgi:hypothetical protein